MQKDITVGAQWIHVQGGIVLSNIAFVLEQRLNILRARLHLDNCVKLVLSGDKGGEITKLTVCFFGVENANSSANHLIIAQYPGQDSRQNLEKYCGKVFDQIKELKTLGDISVDWLVLIEKKVKIFTPKNQVRFGRPIIFCSDIWAFGIIQHYI